MVRLLNLTATRIWQLADGSRSVDEITTILTQEFEVDFQQAYQSVIRLLNELSEKKVIAWVGP
jgi:predicted transcriptional regulator